MKILCRSWRQPWQIRGRRFRELCPHARIITDPARLAELKAAANRQRAMPIEHIIDVILGLRMTVL
jgi:hypothetical protein